MKEEDVVAKERGVEVKAEAEPAARRAERRMRCLHFSISFCFSGIARG